MDRMILEVDRYFIAPLMVSIAILFHYYITAFITGSQRGKIFSKEFMEKNFSEEHLAAFPNSSLPRGGNPDMGNGRYAAKLSYEDWYTFNLH